MSELNAQELWEQGIEHHPESLAIQKSIQKSDIFGIWEWGGDGDNGEDLLYDLDVYFRRKALLDAEPEYCEWKHYTSTMRPENKEIDTTCGKVVFGIPSMYKHCPYCGKPIKEVE